MRNNNGEAAWGALFPCRKKLSTDGVDKLPGSVDKPRVEPLLRLEDLNGRPVSSFSCKLPVVVSRHQQVVHQTIQVYFLKQFFR